MVLPFINELVIRYGARAYGAARWFGYLETERLISRIAVVYLKTERLASTDSSWWLCRFRLDSVPVMGLCSLSVSR